MYSQKVEEFSREVWAKRTWGNSFFVLGRQDHSQVRERKGQGVKRPHCPL